MLHWILTALALVAAVAAWLATRRLARRLDHLTEQYWDLRYQHGQLRAQVQRLDPESRPAAEPEASPSQSFIPLSTLKRGSTDVQ